MRKRDARRRCAAMFGGMIGVDRLHEIAKTLPPPPPPPEAPPPKAYRSVASDPALSRRLSKKRTGLLAVGTSRDPNRNRAPPSQREVQERLEAHREQYSGKEFNLGGSVKWHLS